MWADDKVLGLAHAYEQATHHRRPPPLVVGAGLSARPRGPERAALQLSDHSYPGSSHAKSVSITVFLTLGAVAAAQAPPAATRELGIKYVRDSEEYAVLARQVFRVAGDAVDRARAGVTGPWAVVLDIDETTLDNSTYQVERAVYGLAYENDSWNAWVLRREAPAVPGVKAFIDRVRAAGGHVAWISNREASLAEAIRANLATVGVWGGTTGCAVSSRNIPSRNGGARS
jgi:hypothetical protein